MLVAYFSAIDRARPAVLGSVMRGIIAIAFCAILFSQILGLNGIWLSFLGSEIITFFVILISGNLDFIIDNFSFIMYSLIIVMILIIKF